MDMKRRVKVCPRLMTTATREQHNQARLEHVSYANTEKLTIMYGNAKDEGHENKDENTAHG